VEPYNCIGGIFRKIAVGLLEANNALPNINQFRCQGNVKVLVRAVFLYSVLYCVLSFSFELAGIELGL
jgi:hypothetical protein